MTHALPPADEPTRYLPSGAPVRHPNSGNVETTAIEAPNPKALHTAANAVMAVAVLLFIATVVVGITLCTNTQTVAGAGAFDSSTTTHPYLDLGVALIGAGVFQAVVVLMLGQWAKLYAQVVHARISS